MPETTAIVPTQARLAQGNRQRLARTQRLIDRLPKHERDLWRARVRSKLRTGPRVPTTVAGEWGLTAPGDTQSEWDLELANFLERVYKTVSDRVEEVAQKAGTAVKETADTAGKALSSVGWGMLPLAIGVGLVLYTWAGAQRGRS